MKLIQENEIDKKKCYALFSFLNVRTIFKTKLFEYFNQDVVKMFNATKDDLTIFEKTTGVKVPNNYFAKLNELNIEECYKKAFPNENIKILGADDERYPYLLKQIPDYPISLYYMGDLDSVDFDYNLAVVGSRKASNESKIALNSLIKKLGNTNLNIVSGLAYGADTQAHISAIENNLKTIAVIGSGLDIVYPSANKILFNNIINGNGIVMSEYPCSTQPMPANFPQRNRIVVGLSKGTLVVEAQMKSGALISARLTLEYNRELMCIPGNILNPNTEGIYYLIKNGCSIVTEANDILNYLNLEITLNDKKGDNIQFSGVKKQILEILTLEAKSFDEIINNTDCETDEIMIALTELEFDGLIKQTGNKYYKCT